MFSRVNCSSNCLPCCNERDEIGQFGDGRYCRQRQPSTKVAYRSVLYKSSPICLSVSLSLCVCVCVCVSMCGCHLFKSQFLIVLVRIFVSWKQKKNSLYDSSDSQKYRPPQTIFFCFLSLHHHHEQQQRDRHAHG